MNMHGDDDTIGGSSSVEDDILDSVEDITGESFDSDADDQANDEEDDPSAEDDQQEEDPADQEAAPQDAEPRQQSARERIDRSEVAKRIPQQRRVDYDYDGRTGDVINPKTGEVIFKNGTVEREMFTQLRDAQYQHARTEQSMRQMAVEGRRLEQLVEGYKKAPSVADNLGLNTEDQVRAFAMMAEYKKNPVQAFRKMLNDYQVDGGDLTDIFDNLEKIQLEGLEARLGKQINELTAPQREAKQREQAQSELVNRLNTEITTFFSSNPEAEQHVDTLTHIINRAGEEGRQISLNDAWTRLLRFAAHNGLDPRQDMRAQLEARQQPQPEAPRVPRRPMPNGRANSAQMQRQSDKTPNYERRNRDIVAEAMREAGFTDV